MCVCGGEGGQTGSAEPSAGPVAAAARAGRSARHRQTGQLRCSGGRRRSPLRCLGPHSVPSVLTLHTEQPRPADMVLPSGDRRTLTRAAAVIVLVGQLLYCRGTQAGNDTNPTATGE